MASPELLPGAGSPQMLMEGKPLKRSSLGRAGSPAAGGKGRKGNHLARRIPDIEFFQILGQHAVGGVGLDVHPLDPAALDEVVDIGAAEGRRDRLVDGGDGDPQGAGLFPIHVDPVFGHIFHAVGPNAVNLGSLAAMPEELVLGRHQGLRGPDRPGPATESRTPWPCPVR